MHATTPAVRRRVVLSVTDCDGVATDLGPIDAQKKGLSYPGNLTSKSFAQHAFKNLVGPSGQAYLQQDPRIKPLHPPPLADRLLDALPCVFHHCPVCVCVFVCVCVCVCAVLTAERLRRGSQP